MSLRRRAMMAGLAVGVAASLPCPGGAQGAPARGGRGADSAAADSVGRAGRGALVPAGLGSLKFDDVALVVQLLGLTVKALPLEEGVIRVLAPDTYRSKQAIRESKAQQVEAIRRRLGFPALQAWHVMYFNVQQGEARFDPADFLIRSAGRDFRPLDVLPLETGFTSGRLAQGRTVSAVYVFDPAIDLSQPLTVTIAGQRVAKWEDAIRLLDAERARIWSRAAAAPPRAP